jgi:hypothetical protein
MSLISGTPVSSPLLSAVLTADALRLASDEPVRAASLAHVRWSAIVLTLEEMPRVSPRTLSTFRNCSKESVPSPVPEDTLIRVAPEFMPFIAAAEASPRLSLQCSARVTLCSSGTRLYTEAINPDNSSGSISPTESHSVITFAPAAIAALSTFARNAKSLRTESPAVNSTSGHNETQYSTISLTSGRTFSAFI